MYNISNDCYEFVRDGLTFKFDNGEPSEFAKNIARQELRETPENVENGLKELRKLLREEPNLYCPLDNDIWLLSFLRPAHFYPVEARNMIRNYFNYRTKYPGLYKNLTVESMREFLNDFNGSLLPQRDQNGRRLLVALTGKYWDTKKYNKELLLQACILQAEFIRTESDTQICGVNIILDTADITFRQALSYTPGFLKRLVDFLQDGMCIRIKGYHIVNQLKNFDLVFALARPFIREKFRKRVVFHGSDRSSLHRYISPDCLPEIYGGTLKTTNSYGPEFYELFDKYKKEYDRSMTYGYIK